MVLVVLLELNAEVDFTAGVELEHRVLPSPRFLRSHFPAPASAQDEMRIARVSFIGVGGAENLLVQVGLRVC